MHNIKAWRSEQTGARKKRKREAENLAQITQNKRKHEAEDVSIKEEKKLFEEKEDAKIEALQNTVSNSSALEAIDRLKRFCSKQTNKPNGFSTDLLRGLSDLSTAISRYTSSIQQATDA